MGTLADSLKAKIEPVIERLNDTFFGSFIFSFLVWNYDVVLYFISDKMTSDESIKAIQSSLTTCDWIVPLILSVLYAFIYAPFLKPRIKIFIYNKQSNLEKSRWEYDLVIKQIEKRENDVIIKEKHIKSIEANVQELNKKLENIRSIQQSMNLSKLQTELNDPTKDTPEKIVTKYYNIKMSLIMQLQGKAIFDINADKDDPLFEKHLKRFSLNEMHSKLNKIKR